MGQFVKAKETLEKAVKLEPENSTVHFSLGYAISSEDFSSTVEPPNAGTWKECPDYNREVS